MNLTGLRTVDQRYLQATLRLYSVFVTGTYMYKFNLPTLYEKLQVPSCICCVNVSFVLYLQQNLEGLDMDNDKKSLVSREIRSFRDTYRVS